MASELSLIQFIMGVKDTKVIGFECIGENANKIIHLHVIPVQQKCCPYCGNVCPGYDHHSSKPRKWRDVDYGECKVFLVYHLNRINCPEHGIVTEAVPWANKGDRFTKAFRTKISQRVLDSSNSAVSKSLRVDWKTVERHVHFTVMSDKQTTTSLDGLISIGVDETSYQKGHKYITVVINHETNKVIWVEDKHGLNIFRKFFDSLTPVQKLSIKHVSGDGARWIDQCINEHVPHASRSLDPFHIVQWFGESLDKIRISEYRRLRKGGKIDFSKSVKSSAYTLAKSEKDHTEKQREKLKIIKNHAPKLYSAYQIKEFLRQIIRDKDIENANNNINKLIFRLAHSKFTCLKELGKKLKRHKESLINSLKFKISNARIESGNNKIKLLIRRAFGYRNIVNLKRHIYFAYSQ